MADKKQLISQLKEECDENGIALEFVKGGYIPRQSNYGAYEMLYDKKNRQLLLTSYATLDTIRHAIKMIKEH